MASEDTNKDSLAAQETAQAHSEAYPEANPQPGRLFNDLSPDLQGRVSLWRLIERYVREGDATLQNLGMRMIADFADYVPHREAASLIEWQFERCQYQPSAGFLVIPDATPPDRYKPMPSLDENAVAAALSIGARGVPSVMKPEIRERMAAVLIKSKVATDDARWHSALDRAMRQLVFAERVKSRTRENYFSEQWKDIDFDEELLDHCAQALEDNRVDDALRAAMIVLEARLRASTRAGLETVGVDLATKAFERSQPLNFGQTSAEKDGLLNLFRSVFLLFRNPIAHRFVQQDRQRALHVLALVDLLLDLVAEANTRLYRPRDYLSPNEASGDPQVLRVQLLDVDGDGQDEHLLLYVDPDETVGRPRMGLLLLKEQGSIWRRLPVNVEIYESGGRGGSGIEQFSSVDAIRDGTRMALLRTRFSANEGRLYAFYWADGRLQAARFVSRPNQIEHVQYAEQILRIDPNEQPPFFADPDGDGMLELFVQDRRKDVSGFPGGTVVRATSVYKFVESQGAFVKVDRRLIGMYSPKNEAASKIMREEVPEAQALAQWVASL